MKKITLFEMPIWKTSIPNWKTKKKKLENELNSYEEIKKAPANFASNRWVKEKKELVIVFYNIFKEQLNKFSHEIQSNYEITDIWSSSYEQGDYQNPHNHGTSGYTGIVYLDFPKKSQPTQFVQPWNDEVLDHTILTHIDVKEGDMLLFSKSILHFSPAHKNKKRKRILSWDMSPKPWLKR